MEPITTTAIISLITYWGGKAFDKAFDTVTGEFSKGSVNWLKSIFFNGDKPTEVLEKYQNNPDSPARQNAVKAAIDIELEDNPDAKTYLNELLNAIASKSGNTLDIKNSKNINTGQITSSGSVIIGDNNQNSK